MKRDYLYRIDVTFGIKKIINDSPQFPFRSCRLAYSRRLRITMSI